MTTTDRNALDLAAARIVKLEEENKKLKDEAKLYDEFIVNCTEVIPEGFDDDAAAESVILNYLNELNSFAGIIARLTSAYR